MTQDNLNTELEAVTTGGHDIIVIGGSSGSLSPLRAVLQALPRALPAGIFVALHRAASSCAVTELVGDASPLPVIAPRDGEAWQPRSIYVAPADDHLMFDTGGVLRVLHGPRENAARPSIDALFRSAAVHYGPRVVGVLLSGRLFDGAAGLAAIERCGGATVVQDPSDAMESELPASALAMASVHHCIPAAAIAHKLVELVHSTRPGGAGVPAVPEDLKDDARLAIAAGEINEPWPVSGAPSLRCPACDGPLDELSTSGLSQVRCKAGDAFSPDSPLVDQVRTVERALWIALRTLQERAIMLRRMAADARRRGFAATAQGYDAGRMELDEHVRAVRRAIGMATSAIAPPIAVSQVDG